MFDWIVSTLVSLPTFRGKTKLFSLIPYLPYRRSRTAYRVSMHKNIHDATYWFALTGAYGRFIENIIRRERHGFVFIDIGANQGLFSLIAAQNNACKRIFAFEPNPHIFALLVNNIELNSARIDPICAAITSGPPRSIKLKWLPKHSGLAHISENNNLNEIRDLYDVHSVGLDRTFIDLLPISSTDEIIVKIDVEGHEVTVLKELLASNKARQIRSLIIELNTNIIGEDYKNKILSMLEREGLKMIGYAGSKMQMDALFRRMVKNDNKASE